MRILRLTLALAVLASCRAVDLPTAETPPIPPLEARRPELTTPATSRPEGGHEVAPAPWLAAPPDGSTNRQKRQWQRAQRRAMVAAATAAKIKIKNSGNSTTQTKNKDVGNTATKTKDQRRDRQKHKTDARQISRTRTGPSVPWWLWVVAIIAVLGGGWWLKGKFS